MTQDGDLAFMHSTKLRFISVIMLLMAIFAFAAAQPLFADDPECEGGTAYQLAFATVGDGSAGYRDRDPPFDFYRGWYVAGCPFEAIANPASGWYLDHWEINGEPQSQVGLISEFIMPAEDAIVTGVFVPKPADTHIIRWFSLLDPLTRPYNKINYSSIEPEQTLYQTGDVVTLKTNGWWDGPNCSVWWFINDSLADLYQTEIQITLEEDIDVSVEAGCWGAHRLWLDGEVQTDDGAVREYDDLLSASPEAPSSGYAGGEYVEITSEYPPLGADWHCELTWHWHVPSVALGWHELPNHNQTIPVVMDRNKWFRAEWDCASQAQTPVPTLTPTATSTTTPPLITMTPVPPTATRTPLATATSIPPTATPLPAAQYIVEGSAIGEGVISRNPEKPVYSLGETITVGAFPDDGWRFSEWQGDASGDEPVTQIVVDGDVTVIAMFVQEAERAFVYLPVVELAAP